MLEEKISNYFSAWEYQIQARKGAAHAIRYKHEVIRRAGLVTFSKDKKKNYTFINIFVNGKYTASSLLSKFDKEEYGIHRSKVAAIYETLSNLIAWQEIVQSQKEAVEKEATAYALDQMKAFRSWSWTDNRYIEKFNHFVFIRGRELAMSKRADQN